jgi:hypothetical protein
MPHIPLALRRRARLSANAPQALVAPRCVNLSPINNLARFTAQGLPA